MIDLKIRKFDVVELKNRNKAIILMINKEKSYLAEIIDKEGKSLERKIIIKKEINRVIYSRNKER